MKSFFKNLGPFKLKDICEWLKIEIPNGADPKSEIQGAKSIQDAERTDITFFFNTKYREQLQGTRAGFCIIAKEEVGNLPKETTPLVSALPYRDWATVLKNFYHEQVVEGGVSPFAKVHPSASLGENVSLGAFVTVGPYASIGHNTRIDDNTSVGWGVQIGDDCSIGSHVSLAHCHLGESVKIKPGARIGQSGFGFHMDEKGHVDVPQLGCVRIGANTEIGANTCIDRGSASDTIIGKGVRIDNLVQIAHNVEVGDHSILVAQVGIAGSTKLGKFVVAAGQVGIAGHLRIGDGVKIAAQSGIMRSVDAGQTVGGSPAVPVREWHRQTVMMSKLIKDRKA